jgi:hypothetical protein
MIILTRIKPPNPYSVSHLKRAIEREPTPLQPPLTEKVIVPHSIDEDGAHPVHLRDLGARYAQHIYPVIVHARCSHHPWGTPRSTVLGTYSIYKDGVTIFIFSDPAPLKGLVPALYQTLYGTKP